MSSQKSPIKSLQTSLQLIEAIVARGGATLAELTDAVDRPKSTVHSHLKTLVMNDLLIKNGPEYRAGMRFLNIGARARENSPLFEAAEDTVVKLSEATGEQASLMTIERGMGVTMTSHGGVSEVDLGLYPGLYTELHTTAGGKAMLAAMSDDRVHEVVNRHGLASKTKHTIDSIDDLLAALATIRDQGYASNFDERIIGMSGYGAAITDRNDRPVGAIATFGPTQRLRNTDSELAIPYHERVLEAANVVEVSMNYC